MNKPTIRLFGGHYDSQVMEAPSNWFVLGDSGARSRYVVRDIEIAGEKYTVGLRQDFRSTWEDTHEGVIRQHLYYLLHVFTLMGENGLW